MKNKNLTLTGEAVMNARKAIDENNYPKAAFIVAADMGDIYSMRIMSHLQDVQEIAKGRLPIEFNEILRITVLTLRTKLESKATGEWCLNYYPSEYFK